MATGLVGYTGFVGGNLSAQASFDRRYNRADISTIEDQSFDLLVCAGVQAAKWWANQNPQADRDGIATLRGNLETVRVKQFVLISTIDVFGTSDCAADERDMPPANEQPYGRHRLEFERWATERFSNALVVRLPGLFGPHLKKNIIFDLLTGNQTQAIDPASSFQWYDVQRLWRDIETAMACGLDLVHLMPEPVATARLLARSFPDTPVGPAKAQSAHYDIRTSHGAVFGGNARYIASAEQVLEAIDDFCRDVRSGAVSLHGAKETP